MPWQKGTTGGQSTTTKSRAQALETLCFSGDELTDSDLEDVPESKNSRKTLTRTYAVADLAASNDDENEPPLTESENAIENEDSDPTLRKRQKVAKASIRESINFRREKHDVRSEGKREVSTIPHH